MKNKKITNFEELINQTKQNLKDTGYSSTSLYVHGKIWREISKYLSSKGIVSYAPVNGLDYLHYKINYPEILERTLTHDERDFIRAIRFFNEYQENGTIPSALPLRRIIWDGETESLREEFEVFCKEKLNSMSTVKSRMYAASRFMQIILVDKRVKVEKIDDKTISEYVAGLSGYSKATATVHLAGLHILRHTLASELVRQGEAYGTVSAILGHSGIGSTDAYTHIDLDGLLKCALELREVTSHE